MKIRIFILIIGISFLQISILFAQNCEPLSSDDCTDYWYCQLDGDDCAGYEPLIESSNLDNVADNRWSLYINSTNIDGVANEGNNQFHLGMCSECSDGYYIWEESESMNPFADDYIDLYFLHLDYGTGYANFNTDYRAVHPPDQLVVWDIDANISGVDVVHLEWEFDDFLPPEYEIYLFDGDTGYNMRADSSLSLSMEAFYLNGNETNIKLRIGACASTGTTTHYFDNDSDGWGGDLSDEFCLGYAPDGWVQNPGDLNDDLPCESNLIDDCNVCDGFNYDMDCYGICFGSAEFDECGVCNGNGISVGECDCAGNVLDCAGVCGGTSTLELLCEDTDGDGLGNPVSETMECVDENGDINILAGSDLPDLHLNINSNGSVFYNSSESIMGFQFDIDGASIIDASGGDAEANGFMISSNNTTVIAFTFTETPIPPGSGIIIHMELDGEATGLSNIVVSDPYGIEIPFLYYQGDETGFIADCSDQYPDCEDNYYDCADECGGLAVIDECGECDGPGPEPGYTCDGIPVLFIHNSSTQQALYFFTTVTIDDEVIDADDWVGAFNGDVCVGARRWDNCGRGTCDVPVLGDDGTDFTEGYMSPGDIPTFMIFEASENAYYSATPSENIPWSINAYNSLDSLHAISAIDYCLTLHSGANLKSFYALPEDVSVPNIMSELGPEITGVITEGGACSQIAPGTWVGSKCSLEPEKGYWIIVTSANDLCLENATPTDPAIEYGLHAGANLISFPSEGSVIVSDALPDDVELSVAGAITEGGACSQIAPGQWVGSQCTFNGGKGYWIITTAGISFSFDLTNLSIGRIKTDSEVGLIYPEGREIYQSTKQAFYFIENIMINGMPIQTGDWVLAYHDNTLVGAQQWMGDIVDIPVMGYDGNAYSEGYIETGNIPTFKHLDHYNMELSDLYSNNTPQWENNGLYILSALEAGNVIPQEIMLNAYPNPFNPITTLSFSVRDEGMVKLSIYNLSGQLLSELAHKFHSPGIFKYSWDADAFPSGVYFARLNLGPQSYTQKLVLMK